MNPSKSELLSILCLSPSWIDETLGIARVTRALITDLISGHDKLKIHCAVIGEKESLSEQDLEDATKLNVSLVGACLPRGVHPNQAVPEISWLDLQTASYYRHLTKIGKVDFIIGHIPYLANGALNIRDLLLEKGQSPKVVLIAHSLPKTEKGVVDESLLTEWLNAAGLVLSVDCEIADKIGKYLEKLDKAQPPNKAYLPGNSMDLQALVCNFLNNTHYHIIVS